MAVLLAIESSQRQVSVAVEGLDAVVHTEVASGDPRERDLLLPAIDTLCRRAGLAPGDLQAIAVSTGPGGFTGLRVSIATAKGLCESLGIPAIDVPSALVAAQGAREGWMDVGRSVIVALASKGEQCWATLVDMDERGSLVVGWERSVTAGTLTLPMSRVLLGDEHMPQSIRTWCAEAKIEIVEPTFHARDCLAVARDLHARGEVIDPMRLSARYPREPEAVTLWRARQAR
ncbi:MAG: tRNA (adenosine(37)-N6)-threonylcarbamoyltransferase complex dimerization subunit type 1 TsaB [Phycisphaerales bacterium]|nr:tRNA (adenosine(37)-N6)-threonylcarbamoyltransferase complex dimerization subunit type 1 TsaB [Phycisphaerales bacterium]